MKLNDIVVLTKLKKEYIDKNLYKNVSGVILKLESYNKCLVLFLNDKIIGDYAVVQVDNIDIKKADVSLPMQVMSELTKSNKLNGENLLKKQSFRKTEFNECDRVELIVEDDLYTQFGVHKGAVGIVAIDYSVGNTILVDFSCVDQDGNYHGDCISVKIDDLKLIK